MKIKIQDDILKRTRGTFDTIDEAVAYLVQPTRELESFVIYGISTQQLREMRSRVASCFGSPKDAPLLRIADPVLDGPGEE
jgi:hypothetical protein